MKYLNSVIKNNFVDEGELFIKIIIVNLNIHNLYHICYYIYY